MRNCLDKSGFYRLVLCKSEAAAGAGMIEMAIGPAQRMFYGGDHGTVK
jgi:hypothetical protein